MNETWYLDKKRLCLVHVNSSYEIDLERCLTSAQVLDWIMQVGIKRWCTPEVMLDLIYKFGECLHPQHFLCSFGKERGPIDIRKTLELVSKMNENRVNRDDDERVDITTSDISECVAQTRDELGVTLKACRLGYVTKEEAKEIHEALDTIQRMGQRAYERLLLARDFNRE